VPHVRLSVRGPKMIFFEGFQLDGPAAPNGFSLTDSSTTENYQAKLNLFRDRLGLREKQ
jgi:hypothetical protein